MRIRPGAPADQPADQPSNEPVSGGPEPAEPAPAARTATTVEDREPDDVDQPEEETAPPARTDWREFAVYASYTFAAIMLTGPLWADPTGRVLADNYQDQVLFEWMFTHAANSVFEGESPLFSDEVNAPYGLNLMANTSILGLAIPLIPITKLFGAAVSFAIITTLALAGTASAWYYVLRRFRSRSAAALGGAFCGFAPSMISQATGHPNIAGQYVIPFVVLAVLRLREPGQSVRKGLILAGLVVYQAFINEEILFFTALALGIFLLGYLPRRLPWRDALTALGVTTAVAGAVLAYPLYHQFFGPGHYRGLPDYIVAYSADLGSYWNYARRSLVGDPLVANGLAQGATEENSFYGWPLLIALGAIIVWLAMDRLVRALAITAVVFAVMSLGIEIVYKGEPTGTKGPWSWLVHLPLFDSVVPTRLALVVTPLVGCILAVFMDRLEPGRLRTAATVAVFAVLLPLIPTPLPAADRPVVPAFFTSGAWRQHVPVGGTVVGLPMGWTTSLHSMQWQTAANQQFRVFGGYFLAPNASKPDKEATFGPPYPPMITYLEAAERGEPVQATPEMRDQVREDLRMLGADALVMPQHHPSAQSVKALVDQLVGPGVLVLDVWVWDVRNLS